MCQGCQPCLSLLFASSLLVTTPSAVAPRGREPAASRQTSPDDNRSSGEPLGEYFTIQIDRRGLIVPWYSPDFGDAFDVMLLSLWNYWRQIPEISPGVKHYDVYRTRDNEPANIGVGGDQFAMMLSSWNLLHGYTGDRALVDDMIRMADHYLERALSPGDAAWPHLPFPCNLGVYARYDGDLVSGPEVTQPDKAGSFAFELTKLYRITGHRKYLDAAVRMADVLASKSTSGDADASPLPFRVNVRTGGVARGKGGIVHGYTTNWAPTLRLFEALEALRAGRRAEYRTAASQLVAWLKRYPVQNQRWGPFFEDIPMYSDTQINAVTLAEYILDQGEAWGPSWRKDARAAIDWAFKTFKNDRWSKYGVFPVGEQTVYRVPGNGHTARQAAVELLYAERTGDKSGVEGAVRQLAWATYMAGPRGDNEYLENDIWYTDGYGDFVRHFIRAMASQPSLAPSDRDRLLRTSSVVQRIAYRAGRVSYATSDRRGTELLRIGTFDVATVVAGNRPLPRLSTIDELGRKEGFTWNLPGEVPGVLRVRHDRSGVVVASGTR